MAVWIDPQDDTLDTWWAGMIVPKHQVDETMPRITSNEFVVKFWKKQPN
jgi:hypothetical protein